MAVAKKGLRIRSALGTMGCVVLFITIVIVMLKLMGVWPVIWFLSPELSIQSVFSLPNQGLYSGQSVLSRVAPSKKMQRKVSGFLVAARVQLLYSRDWGLAQRFSAGAL